MTHQIDRRKALTVVAAAPAVAAAPTVAAAPAAVGEGHVIEKWRLPPRYIDGLQLSNTARPSDPTNDLQISPGVCRDSTDSYDLQITSTIIKQLDVAWAPSSNDMGRTGMRGPIGLSDTTYHIFVIGGEGMPTDVFAMTSNETDLAQQTIPAGYKYFRRIGSIIRTGGAIKPFWQNGDVFQWQDNPNDIAFTTGFPYQLITLTLPLGLMVQPLVSCECVQNATAGTVNVYVSDARDSANTTGYNIVRGGASNQGDQSSVVGGFFCNTSAQIYCEAEIITTTPILFKMQTTGWIDARGKDGWQP
jgi:hypothetical protein